MKKAALTLFILIFLSAISFLALKARERPLASIAPASALVEIQKAEKITQYVRSPKKDKRFILALSQKESAPFTLECADYFESLATLNLSQWTTLERRPKYRALLRKPEKCLLSDLFLDRMHSEYVRACRIRGKVKVIEAKIDKNIERGYSEPISDECAEKIIYLRATLVRLSLQDKLPNEINEIPSLLDLLLSEFLVVKKEVPLNINRVQIYADRLLELSPNLYLALKTSIYSEVTKTMEKVKSENLSLEAQEPLWKKPMLDLARADQLEFGDERLEDARAAITTRAFNPDKILPYATAYISKYPSSGRGYYLRAYSEWKKKSQDAAVADLNQASALEFKNDLYKDTLIALKKGEPEPFRGLFKFGVVSADFKE